MNTYPSPKRNHLINPVDITVDDKNLDFDTAREIADHKAKEYGSDPMLLAWYQGKTGNHTPKVECGAQGKPGWIVYAESRGANITVDINDEEYVFIYRADPSE